MSDKLKMQIKRDPNKKNSDARPKAKGASNSAGKSKKDVQESKPKSQRSFRLTADASAVLTALKKSRNGHGMTQEAFVAKAICEYGKQVLGKAFPLLRESPAEYVAERLEYLERIVIRHEWENFAKGEPKLAKLLITMVEELQLVPYPLDKGRAKAWIEKQRGSEAQEIKQKNASLAAYARKFGFIKPKKDEEEE